MSSDVIVPKKQMVVDRLRRRMEQYRMRHKVSTEKMGQANTVLFERGFQQTQTLKQKFLETKSKKGAKNKNKSESTATQTQYARTIKQSVPASNSENGIKEELTFDTESLSKPLEYFLDGDDSCDEEAFSQFFRDLPNDLKFMEGEDIGSSLDLPDIGLTEQLNGSCSSTPSENNLKEEPRTPSEPRSQQSLSVPHTPKSESPFPPPSPGNIVGNPNAPGPIPASGAAQTLQKLARKHNQGSNNTSGNPCSSPVPTPSSATVYKRGTPSPASGAISPLDAPVRTPSPMRQQGPSPSFPGYQHLQHPHPYAPGASGSPLTNGQMHFNHMKQPPNFQPQMNSQQPSFHNGLPPRVPGTGEGPPPPYPGNGPAPMMMGGQMHLPQLPYSSAALDSTRAVRPVTTSTWNQIAVCPPSMSVSPSPMHMGGGPQMSFSQQRMGMPPSSVPMGVPPSSALPQGAMPPQMMGSGQRMVFHSMPGGRGGPPDAYMIPQGPQQTIMMRMPNSKLQSLPPGIPSATPMYPLSHQTGPYRPPMSSSPGCAGLPPGQPMTAHQLRMRMQGKAQYQQQQMNLQAGLRHPSSSTFCGMEGGGMQSHAIGPPVTYNQGSPPMMMQQGLPRHQMPPQLQPYPSSTPPAPARYQQAGMMPPSSTSYSSPCSMPMPPVSSSSSSSSGASGAELNPSAGNDGADLFDLDFLNML